MPSKKRKYNARFPAGRIKRIMQTDEEVGKVAQAVPIIIYSSPTPRTLELFVESLLKKALEVTTSRNAKTLSPSHVKQCILAESRFDFLRDLVLNIPDVSAAEEKEMMSAENSPNSSRFSDMTVTVPPRRIAREDSNSSSSSDIRVQQIIPRRDTHPPLPTTPEVNRTHRTETVTSTAVSDTVIDLSKKATEEAKPQRTAFFYQETLNTDESNQHRSVITLNPTYNSPQPSTSASIRVEPLPKPEKKPFYIDVRHNSTSTAPPRTPNTPIMPILNIDFTKNLAKPEIKVLDSTAANIAGVHKNDKVKSIQRQNSKVKLDNKKVEVKTPVTTPVNIDLINSGNLQIDEDYDT